MCFPRSMFPSFLKVLMKSSLKFLRSDLFPNIYPKYLCLWYWRCLQGCSKVSHPVLGDLKDRILQPVVSIPSVWGRHEVCKGCGPCYQDFPLQMLSLAAGVTQCVSALCCHVRSSSVRSTWPSVSHALLLQGTSTRLAHCIHLGKSGIFI